MALFAPGWVYEGEANRSRWQLLNEQLWSSIGAALGWSPRPMITSLPFFTTFCYGSGNAFNEEVGPLSTRITWLSMLCVIGHRGYLLATSQINILMMDLPGHITFMFMTMKSLNPKLSCK